MGIAEAVWGIWEENKNKEKGKIDAFVEPAPLTITWTPTAL